MAGQDQKEDCVKMGPEAEEQVTCLEVKSDYVEEPSRNNSLDIIKKLGFFQSMSTDEKIKQFQMFLTTALINDLVRQLSEVQYLFLLHYFVMALCSRGQAQDLSEAEKQIMAIKKMTKETPECQSFVYVAYHTFGCLYFKQNRFEEAMKWFQNSKQEFQDNPPTIEWTDVVLKAEEIEPKHFVIKINEYIEMCKHAPNPVAICQDANCYGYYKREIYPSDPDYKGYIEFCCDSYCLIAYHLTCWKRLKETQYHGKSNQDFCSMKCMSSDCKGLIIKCVIHQASGSIQTEFEIKISDLSPQISAIKHEQKAVDTLEGSNQCNEQNEYEKGRKEKEPALSLSTDWDVSRLGSPMGDPNVNGIGAGNQFDEQINLVKSGTKLSMLPKIKIPPPPPHPDAVMKHFLEQHLQAKANNVLTGFGPSKSSSGRLTSVTGQAEASAAAYEQVRGTIPISEQTTSQQFLPAAKGPAGLTATPGGTRGKNSFERIMERLSTSYPHFTRGSLTDFLKEVRLSNGGSLSGLSYDEIVNKVAQLVESKLSESSNSDQNQPPNKFAWSSSRQQEFNSWEGARAMTEEQDPCVICHEELTVESMLVLPCAHKFHSQVYSHFAFINFILCLTQSK
ncbi:uncharacterized protein LOC109934213 [Rhincodon typus]|uniref:uncharacterized protein LOC109934213 n=1 Tax=Rhincodon typus TaxID=259920 RepID=UPI00202FA4BC|nr:uncharacterized protein LOC109934213 [Rhincodon typus]